MTPTRKIGLGALALAAAGAVGISLATLGTADAAPSAAATATTIVDADTADTATDATTSSDDDADDPLDDDADGQRPHGPHSANGVTEVELAGDEAASVEAAVLAAYPDATIERMENDAEGAAFEAHVTLADGSDATVKLDASFAVTETVDGHG